MIHPPVQALPDEEKEMEYTVKLEFRVIVEEDENRTVTVRATDEDGAIEEAWDKLREEFTDEELEEDGAEIVSVSDPSVRGAADDKTLNLFPNFQPLPRGTKGASHARQ